MLKVIHKSPATLGDVLYAKSTAVVPEQDWAKLVQAIARGDQLALHAIYERAHRPVFTLMLRLTASPAAAEELTVDVFHELWRLAPGYDPAKGTALGWIMNLARARAMDHLGRNKRGHGGDALPAADPRDMLELRRQGESLRAALQALTPDENRAIETTFFAGYTHAEAAVWLNQPFGAIKTLLRSALYKLRQALVAEPKS